MDAVVILKKQQWVVKKCPYCQKTHYHGAGSIDDNPNDFLGHRSSHCLKGNAGYNLIKDKGGNIEN